ncbi:ABC transmembrane type-1 domain-containing protein [Aphelenchoides besseyi]|nr:ABC transmembrane type-1 domain-containing protein [Aphelenchoides besseyi]
MKSKLTVDDSSTSVSNRRTILPPIGLNSNLHSITRLVWEFSSIRQVFRARKAYVRKLLHMDVSWLESRHSGQIASTLHELVFDRNRKSIGCFSHADSIHQGIADHVPMTVFIFSYLAVTLGVCFYIQWDVTLVMLLALPVLIGTRMIFSKVKHFISSRR